MTINRRVLIAATASFLLGVAASSAEESHLLSKKFAEVETRLDARLGVVVLDMETGKEWTYRPDERFPLNSTFKAFACAGVLARVDAGKEDLARMITFEKRELVAYSPVTEKNAGKGMSLADLCKASTGMSDNTAANKVLDSLGGPAGFTAFMRSIGDRETRLDRRETDLNEATPGDPRDTTTPRAAAGSLRALLLGDILSDRSRRQLEDWLAGNQVGGPLLRASLPEGWRIADRTGAGGHGARSVIAVIWPPKRKPVVAAVYLTETNAGMDARNAAIAELGGVIVDVVSD